MNPQTTLDPKIVNLAKAVRQIESNGNFSAVGKSGEYGAYQYTEPTWAADSKKYGVNVPLRQATPQQQNEVAYKKFEDLYKQGYNVGQIASIHNSGSPKWDGKVGVNSKGVAYDVPAYVNKVATTYQQIKNGSLDTTPQPTTLPKTPAQLRDQQSAEQYTPTFASQTGEGVGTSALKTLGNIPKSAFNFAKGIISSLNPLNTLKNLAQIPGEFQALSQETGGNALGAFAKQLPGSAYETLVPEAGRSLVSATGGLVTGNMQKFDQGIDNAKRTIENDPVGQILPFILAAQGGAKYADTLKSKSAMADYVKNISKDSGPIPKPTTAYSDAFDRGMSRVASPVLRPLSKIAGGVASTVGGIGDYAVSKVTGLEPDTLNQIKENPSSFTKESQTSINRPALAAEVKGALDTRIKDLGETGSAYKPIRESTVPVKVEPSFLDNSITDTTGVDIQKGKIKTSGAAKIRDARDVRALQNLYDTWKPVFKKGQLATNEFLNFRSDLAKLSKFERDLGKSSELEASAKIIRRKLNESYRPQIDNLSTLDENFAKQTAELQQLRKGILGNDGNLTDGAITRIANATNLGRDQVLTRLEQTLPGITKKIKILKAIEDIQKASGNKVGTYTRSALQGGGVVGGLATGNIPLIAGSIVSAILASPEVAVPLLRKYGMSKILVNEVLRQLKDAGATVNGLPSKIPTILSPVMNKTPQPLSQ